MTKSVEEILHSVDVLDPEQADHMVEALAEARLRFPVLRSEADGGYYLVTRYDDVRSVCERPDDFTNANPAVRGLGFDARLIPLDADPPLHRDYRLLLNKYFTQSYLRRHEPSIREIAEGLVDDIVTKDRFDFVYDYAVPLTAGVLTHIVFTDEPAEFMQRAVSIVERVAAESSIETFIELGMVAAEALAHVDERVESDETVLGAVCRGTVDGGRPLTGEERLGIVAALLSGGLDTTRSAMANIAYHLAVRPELEARLRNPQWVRTDLDEFLRIQPTVSFMARTAKRDTTVGGQQLAAGDRVVLSYLSANRDDSRFENPDELTFGTDRKASAAFGLGIHRCLGVHLAKLQIEVAFDVLLSRLTELRIEPGVDVPRQVGISGGAPEHLPLVFQKV
jgi:cytochrome P450